MTAAIICWLIAIPAAGALTYWLQTSVQKKNDEFESKFINNFDIEELKNRNKEN
jgi:hypothetical protein